MVVKRIFAFILIGLLTTTVFAQQDPHFSQNMFNHMAINPGFAGSSDMINATAINRLQWVGFGDGAPITTVVNINAPFTLFGKSHGAGLNITNDRFGFNSDIGVALSYAYRFKIARAGNLAIGINGGVVNNTMNPTWNFPVASGDVAVPQKEENSVNLDLGLGLFYNNDQMYFGFSATHLNQSKNNKAVNPSHYKTHFYLCGGYFLALPNKQWEVNPSVFVGTTLSSSILSLNTNLIYNKRFWGGVSYRVGEAVAAMVGAEIFSGLRIGYAFDFSTTKISSYNSGSHEFMLGYSFTLKKEKPPQQYKSIRFL